MPAAAPAGFVARTDEDRLYRKVTLRLLPVLFVAYVLNYIDRTNVGYAQLQMKDQLAFGDAVFGLGAGIFFIGYALFEVPSNLLLTRWGARATFLRIMAAWGLISAAMAFVQTPAQFYVARFLLGVAEAGFAPGVLFYFGLWYPAQRRAQTMALFFAAFAAAPIVSGPLAGVIMTWLDGWQSLRGWQWLFILEGLPSVALGVFIYYWLDDGPAKAKWLTDAEKRVVIDAVEKEAAQAGREQRLRDVIGDPRIWLLGGIYFLVLLGVYAVTFWQPTMMQSMGLSVMEVGLYSAIPPLAGVGAAILNGRHSDQTGERRWHFAIPIFAGAVGLALTSFALQNPAIAVVCLALVTAGLAAGVPVFWSIPSSFLSKTAAAAGIALINTIGVTSAVVAPPMVGFLRGATGGFAASLYILSGALILAGLLMLYAWRHAPALKPAAAA